MSPDTIAAVATPPGTAALAVLRVSGPDSFRLLADLTPGRPLPPPRQAALRSLTSRGEPLDTAVVTRFPAPGSYTGEDLVELSCHGNPLIARRVLDALLAAGARLARPGEFTERAFWNQRLDLTAAESVMELLTARTDAAVRAAFAVQRGGLRDRTAALRDELVGVLAHLEAHVDFPDEDISPDTREALDARLAGTRDRVTALLDTAAAGRLLREGARAVIVGSPNAGKSSLLNALLGRDRAIVHDRPGTTRDTVEDWTVLHGVAFHLVDTAGLRDTPDPVEREGVRRSEEALQAADLVLHVFAADTGWTPDDDALAARCDSGRTLRLAAKCDLAPAPAGALGVSPRDGTGLEELKQRMAGLATRGAAAPEDLVTVNARQATCLAACRDAITRTRDALAAALSPEFVALDLRDAVAALDDLVGATTNEHVLDALFRHFCIGK